MIGAGTVHHDVATSALLQQKCPVVAECAGTIGDPQVRNRGTHRRQPRARRSVGRHAGGDGGARRRDPPQGSQGLAGGEGAGFFQDLFTVDMAADELIVSVAVRAGEAAAYAKLHQRASHYAIVGVAAALEVRGGTIAVGAGRADRRRRRTPCG